ncbi:MAG: hypothetical protein EOO01_29085 [Chitinophagaceae bacterium]|nr:MAG: hypothetical protein EOO01_29085 [Chitinophagaceae bacterium]
MFRTFTFACLLIVAAIALPSCDSVKDGYEEGYTQAYLKDLAADLNKRYPLTLNEELRIDSVSVKERTIVYNYTMVNYAKEDIDTVYTKETFKPLIKSVIDTTASIKVLKDKKISFKYQYRDKNGAYAFSFAFKARGSAAKKKKQ